MKVSRQPINSIGSIGWGWVIALLLSWFVVCPPTAVADDDLKTYVEENAYRVAYGMYLNDQKLGWVIEELKLGEFEGKPAAIYEDESLFTTEFFGEKEESTSTSKTIYSLEGVGEIVYSEIHNVEDGKTTDVVIRRVEDGFEVLTTIGDSTSVRRVGIPKEVLREDVKFDQWLTGDRSAGDSWQMYSADFEAADIDVLETFTYVGSYEIEWRGKNTKVIDLDIDVMGGEGKMTLTPDGKLVKGTLGGFLQLVSEEESSVKEMSGGLVDLFAASSIKLDRDLGDPENVKRLVLKIENQGNFTFPESPRQRVKSLDDGGLLVTIEQKERLDEAQPLTDDEKKEYLASTPAVMCDHPSIMERARKIIRSETDSLKQGERIMKWVYRNLDAAAASNATTSIQVLDQRAGDCTEHSLLCVALARAAGIPAREVSGVMYGGEGTQFFAWHAWVEIHDGHQWIAIDPTWNQMNVDATHLKFSHDENDLSWTNVVGQLKVTVNDLETTQDE